MSSYTKYNGNADDLVEKYKNALSTSNISPADISDPNNPISQLVYYNDLNAVKQRISDWVASRLTARHVFVPNWSDLIRVYDYVIIDSHVTGIINGIKQKIKGKEFVINDPNGDINIELTKALKTKWFSRYTDFFVESFFFPYSLVELGDYQDGKFPDIQMIKREYIVPQYKSVKLYLNGSSVPKNVQHWPQAGVRTNPAEPGNYLLIYFEGEERVNDYVFMQCPLHDLGLLDMAAPHALGKMGSLSFFLDYLQKFVVPFRHGKTNINDNQRRNNMDAMMSAWGASGYAVTDLEDEISLLESGGGATAPYTELFKYSNNEISKAFASAVGIFDEKNFVGSAEAGERMFDALIGAYCKEFEYNVNDELIPRLALRDKRYTGKTFEYVNKEVVPYAQRIDAITKLSVNYDLDPEEVAQKSDFKIEKKEVPVQLQNNKPELDIKNKPTKEKNKPTKEMIENATRALKYAQMKRITSEIDANVIGLAQRIINNLGLLDSDFITISDYTIDSEKPYTDSIDSVIFDLCGGKEGLELAKQVK